MKKYIAYSIVFILFITVKISYSQKLKYTDITSGTVMKGDYTSYLASDNFEYKIGDKIKIGFPSQGNKTFAFITEGDGLLLPITNVTSAQSGMETEIKKIAVVGNKRNGFKVALRSTASAVSKFNIDFENALSQGEIKGFGKNSDEALKELKNAKDKLDLGIITKEEYEKIKGELSKYIK
jgi:hypothetical protein